MINLINFKKERDPNFGSQLHKTGIKLNFNVKYSFNFLDNNSTLRDKKVIFIQYVDIDVFVFEKRT